MRLSLPILWLISLAMIFAIAGAPVFGLGNAPVDYSLHDTYYVVAHTRHVISIGVTFLVFAALYGFFKVVFGVEAKRKLGLLHWGVTSVGAILIFAPTLALSLMGTPDRYIDYPRNFAIWNAASSSGYILTLASIPLLLVVIFEALVRRWRPTDRQD